MEITPLYRYLLSAYYAQCTGYFFPIYMAVQDNGITHYEGYKKEKGAIL